MIHYLTSCEFLTPEQLTGFFVGWPKPPSAETHLRLLRQSSAVVLAVDESTRRVVGFITALTDGVLSAYIPLLEVLPDYQGQGIGRALVEHMLAQLKDCYMIDLVCDDELRPFYARLGLRPAAAMILRNYSRQSGGE